MFLYLVRMRSRRGQAHAVLAVQFGQKAYVLDNYNDRLPEIKQLMDYTPAFAFSRTESGDAVAWLSGRDNTASSDSAPDAPRPMTALERIQAAQRQN